MGALKYIFLQHPCRVRYDWSNNRNLAMVRSIELASSWRCVKGREGKIVEDMQCHVSAHTALDSAFPSLLLEHSALPRRPCSFPCLPHPSGPFSSFSFKTVTFLHPYLPGFCKRSCGEWWKEEPERGAKTRRGSRECERRGVKPEAVSQPPLASPQHLHPKPPPKVPNSSKVPHHHQQ